MLIDSHSVPVKRREIEGHLPLEHVIGFCKTFRKITKNLELHLTSKRNDSQNKNFTTLANVINVAIKSLYLFVPILKPNTNTQVMFDESIKNNYTITFDSWYTARK